MDNSSGARSLCARLGHISSITFLPESAPVPVRVWAQGRIENFEVVAEPVMWADELWVRIAPCETGGPVFTLDVASSRRLAAAQGSVRHALAHSRTRLAARRDSSAKSRSISSSANASSSFGSGACAWSSWYAA